MNIVVTGGAGFIGSHLVDSLLKNGAKITVFDNLVTGKRKNINNKVKFVYGDIRDTNKLNKVLSGCDVIFHLAAFTSVPESFIKEKECIEINEIAFSNILSVAAKKNIKRIVFSSSSAVYPDDVTGPFNEKSITKPSSPYGTSKLNGEKILYKWSNEERGRVGVSLQYFNVYGPRQEADSDYASVIPKFLKNIYLNNNIFIYGDGNQTRDYIYVSDIVRANVLAMELLSYKCFVVGTGVELSINALVKLIEKTTGKNIQISYKPLPLGDALRSCADIQLIKKYGWKSSTNIVDGLQSTWDSINN